MCECHREIVKAVRESVTVLNMVRDACLPLERCDSWQGVSQ